MKLFNLQLLVVAVVLAAFGLLIWAGTNAFLHTYASVKENLSELKASSAEVTIPEPHQRLRKYLSLALYGNDDFFTIGAVRNVELAKFVYPGWTVRVYINSSVPLHTIEALQLAGAEVVDMSREDRLNQIDGRFWRFLVADEPDMDYFVSRDVDSRISTREKCAVDEWIALNKTLHCMRDHPMHGQPIMAGMFGLKRGWQYVISPGKPARSMRDLILEFKMRGKKGDDQIFLKDVIWSALSQSRDFVSHDTFSCMDARFVTSLSFPCPRTFGQYVGQKTKGYHDKPSTSLRVSSAPVECRRRPEWQYG